MAASTEPLKIPPKAGWEVIYTAPLGEEVEAFGWYFGEPIQASVVATISGIERVSPGHEFMATHWRNKNSEEAAL